MNMDKDDIKVFFPITENTQLVGIEVQLSDSRPDAGFMLRANGISAADRQDFCHTLEGLLGDKVPVKLFYHYRSTADYKRWQGGSHQLSSYIAYARAQSDEGPDHPFPPLCATALLDQRGNLQPVSSAGHAFESKLKTVLAQAESLECFLYAESQPKSDETKTLLQQLEEAGVSCIPVNTVADIPPQLVGTPTHPASASATQATAQTAPAAKPHPLLRGFIGAAALLVLMVVLYPLLSDLSEQQDTRPVIEQVATPAPPKSTAHRQESSTQQPTRPAEARFTFEYPGTDLKTQVKAGDTLSEGKLYPQLTVHQPGYYYWFAVGESQRPEYSAPIQLVAELFHIAGQPHYNPAGATLEFPKGIKQTDDPGYLEFILVNSPRPLPELDRLMNDLSSSSFTWDDQIPPYLNQLLIDIDPVQIQRSRFIF